MKTPACLSPRRPPSKSRFESKPGRPALPEPRLDYPLFIAHADVPTARQAMTRLGEWLRRTRPECRLVPMLWRFDQLGDPHWQKLATPDLGRAAGLVIALKKDAGPGPELEAWLSLVAKRARGRTISAMVIIDGEETWTVSLQHLPPKAVPRPPAASLPAREAATSAETSLEPAGVA